MHHDVGFAEHGEQIARAGVGEIGHVEVGVDPRLQHGERAHPVHLAGMGIEVEGGGDQQVEAGVERLLGGSNHVRPSDSAVFGADEDRCAAGGRVGAVTSHNVIVIRHRFCERLLAHRPLGHQPLARPQVEAFELEPVGLVRLVDAALLEVGEDHLGKVGALAAGAGLAAALGGLELVEQAVVHVHRGDAVGRKALDRERPRHAHLGVVGVGLVVEVFGIGLGGDRGVDFLLSGDALRPPIGVKFPDLVLAAIRHPSESRDRYRVIAVLAASGPSLRWGDGRAFERPRPLP